MPLCSPKRVFRWFILIFGWAWLSYVAVMGMISSQCWCRVYYAGCDDGSDDIACYNSQRVDSPLDGRWGKINADGPTN